MPGRTLIPWLLAVSFALAAVGEPPDGQVPDPAAPGLDVRQRFEALVERTHYQQARLETLQARFVQRRESPLLLTPEESRGTVAFEAPDRVRWDFTAPGDTVILIRDQRMVTWYRDLGRAEVVELGRQGDRFLQLLGPGASLTELQRYFDVRATFPQSPGEPYRLELDPRIARVRKRIRSMTFHLDPELFVPIYLRFVEAGDQVTELHFEALEINGEIPGEHFELELPEDVETQSVDFGGIGGS